jgi:hypothetical protein
MKDCVALPTLLVAMNVIGKLPAAVGVPLSTPAPVAAANVTPAGNAPVSVTVGVGIPVVVAVKELATPTVKLVLLPLVNAGGTLPPVVTVRVAVPLTPPRVALIVAVPLATPVAKPPVTVATEVLVELQVAGEVRFDWEPSL